jgi:hypothetical protein
MGAGAYDAEADVLFNRTNVHGYFMEYDSERAGGFEPLRLVPKGKIVVLGLVIDRRRWVGPGILVLASAGLTQLVYPLLYDGIVSPAVLPVAVLTLRNVALVVLLGWMLVRLVRLPAPVPALVRTIP